MTQPTLPPVPGSAPDASSGNWSRRSFLLATALGVAATTFSAPWMSAGAFAAASPQFHGLSEFLTGKSLDTTLTERAFSALSKVDSGFDAKAQALNAFIEQQSLANVDALSVAPGFTPELKATAMAIISSYYLGYAGTARPGKAHDDTQFVTYTQALMYRLTYDYTPIPSYSRWGTGYWTDLPHPG
jgi:fructose 5-dehydrogenase small subunit